MVRTTVIRRWARRGYCVGDRPPGVVRGSVGIFASLLALILVAGCGGHVRLGRAEAPIDRAAIEARAGVVVDHSATAAGDALTRTEAALELVAGLGNREEASTAATAHLEAARTELALARLEGRDSDAVRDARRALHRAATRAIEIGRWADDASLVVSGVLLSRHPSLHRADLKWALDAAPSIDPRVDPTPASSMVRRDPVARIRLADGSNDLDAKTREAMLAAALRDLGRRPDADALDLASRRLQQLAGRRAPLDESVDAAKLVHRIDPTEPRAACVLLLAQEIEAGRLTADAELVRDVVSWTFGAGAIARMQLRAEAAPESDALALAHAWVLLRTNLVGDAHQQLVQSTTARPRSDQSEQLRAGLQARVAAATGDLDTLEGRLDLVRSGPSLLAFIAALDREGALPSVRRPAADARRRLLRTPAAVDAPELALRTALDREASGRTRRAARRALRRLDPSLSTLADACHDLKLGADACVRLARVLADAEQPPTAFIGALEAIAASPHVSSDWLDGAIGWDRGSLLALAHVLQRFVGTRLEATGAFQSAALNVAIARGDLEAAQNRLATAGTMLEVEERIWAQLAIADLAAGHLGIVQALETRVWIPPLGKKTFWWPSETVEGDGLLRAFHRGMALLADGDASTAATVLEPVIAAAPGAGATSIAAILADAAARKGDIATARRMTDVARRHGPRSAAVAWLDGTLAARAHDDARARRHFATALRRDPSLEAAYDALVALDHADASATLDFIIEAAPFPYHASRHVADARRRGELDDVELAREIMYAADGDDDRAWRLGARGRPFAPVAGRAVQWALQRIDDASSPQIARTRAEKAIAYIESGDDAHVWNDDRLRLLFLAGRTQAALALAERGVPQAGVQPAGSSDTLVLLLRARDHGDIDDALAWSLYRWMRTGQSDAAVAHLLANPPATTELLAVACQEQVVDDTLTDDKSVCTRAWRAKDPDPSVPVNLSYVLLNEADTDVALLAEIFADKRRPTPFDVTAARPRRDAEITASWFQNRAVWSSTLSQHAEAAADWRQAFALGSTYFEGDVARAQLPFRGSIIRASQTEGAASRAGPLARLAYLALSGGDLVAAGAYAQAARAVAGADDEQQSDLESAERTADATVLATADVERGLASPEVLLEAAELLLAVDDGPRANALHERHPKSHMARLAGLQARRIAGELPEARTLADTLLTAFPRLPLVLESALPVLLHDGDIDEARALYVAARAAHPGHRGLADAALPESITGPRPDVPAWARDAAAYAERLAAIDDDALLALAPRYRFHTAVAADAFFPASHTEREDTDLGSHDGAEGKLSIVTFPRASRCKPRACAEQVLGGIARTGVTVLWTRDVEIPAGRGVEMLVSGNLGMSSILVFPSGGRVFQLVASAPHERFESMLEAIALLHRGFAPLDRVLPAFRAAALRTAGHRLPDRLRLRGRLASNDRSKRCAIRSVLEDAKSLTTRAELMLDAYLAAATPRQRRRLLRCTAPHEAAARRIALVSLLEDDETLHRFGREAVSVHPTRVLTDVDDVLSGPLEPPLSAPDRLAERDLPPHGLLEVLLALPVSPARQLAADLLRSTDRRQRGLAWVAASFRHELVPTPQIRAAIREADADDARLALLALRAPLGSEDLDAIRARLDSMKTIRDTADLVLVRAMAWALASAVHRDDRRRLSGLPKRVETSDDDQEHAKWTRKFLESTAKDHARALALARDPSRAGPDDARAVAWLQASRRDASARPNVAEALRTQSLAELLPGRDWTYARVSNPGLFAGTVADVAGRLKAESATERIIAERFVRDHLRDSGFAVLLEGGGLDTRRPIECASPAGSEGFVCTATVADRTRVLSELGRRDYGQDSGVVLPMQMAQIGVVPMALTAMPLVLHAALDHDDDPSDGELDPVVATERFRHTQRFEELELEHYAIVQLREHGVGVDTERYVFIENRLWVFATQDVAERVLSQTDALPLSADDGFRRLTHSWHAGSALQSVSLGLASPQRDTDVGMEVVVDGKGLGFRYAGTTDADVQDVSAMVAMLPDDAASVFALGKGPMGVGELEAPDHMHASEVAPPFAVFDQADAAALAWYPQPGEGVWSRWLAAVRLTPAVRKAARAAKVELSAPGVAGRGRLHTAVRDDVLLVGSTRDLVGAALSRPRPTNAGTGAIRFAHGRFEGARVARALQDLRTDDDEGGMLARFIGGLSAMVDDVSFEATWDPKTRLGVIEGHLRLRLRAEGDADELIDRWLAAQEGKNASRLPRRLGDRDLERTLVFELEVPDAETFIRTAVVDSPRVRAKARGRNRVELIVAPTVSGPAQTLSSDERKRLLESTSALRSDDPRMKKLSRTIVPEGTAPDDAARRVVAWVHGRIAYEVTPRSLSGMEILDAGRGDCTEYARLTVALLRAAGIPAEVRDGMAASDDEMVAHAWVAYHDGKRWHEVDPTWGRTKVTSGHIELSVLDVLALVSLGQFHVRAITTAP